MRRPIAAVLSICAAVSMTACTESGPDLLAVDRRPFPDHGLVVLRAGSVAPMFHAGPFGHIMQIDVAQERSLCVLAYVPPPSGRLQSGASLYLLPLGDREGGLQLLEKASANEYLLDPAFSPDTATLYFVRVRALGGDPASGHTLTIEARSMEENGETRPLLKDAIWPAPAPNGRQLAVVTVRPEDGARGLGLYDLERDTLRQLVAPGRFDDVDSPVFSTDGRWLYFFAADYSTVSAPDVLAGWRGVAHAHSNQPGLWWRIGVSGGGLEAVTADPEIVSHGTMTPDGRLLYTSSAGVRLVAADGVRTLFAEPFYGAVAALAPR